MIKLFVFDLGGVILPFEHTQIARKLQKRSRLRGKISAQEIFSILFDVEEGLVNPYEEGRITSLEFFSELKERFSLELEFDEFKEIWNPIFTKDDKVIEIISGLKSLGYTLYLLSNTNELHFSYIEETYKISSLFDRLILSFEVGAKKPKRKIFDSIFEGNSFLPKETFYVDDVPFYVEMALSYGMKGHVFTGAENLKREIKELGVSIP